MTTPERFDAAFEALGARPPEGSFEAWRRAHAEPHRAYHTAEHIAACLALLDEARHLCARPAEVELALWYHDAVYDTRTGDSEARSADWAAKVLEGGGADAACRQRVQALILATVHDAVPSDGDARVLVDIDLSILGAPEAEFEAYDEAIRTEYEWVPLDAYRSGRRRILAAFLERPAIYTTPWLHERLEARARDNLARKLAELEA